MILHFHYPPVITTDDVLSCAAGGTLILRAKMGRSFNLLTQIFRGVCEAPVFRNALHGDKLFLHLRRFSTILQQLPCSRGEAVRTNKNKQRILERCGARLQAKLAAIGSATCCCRSCE